MKTFNFYISYEELSFNEILPILIVMFDGVEVSKFNNHNELGYYINGIRVIKDRKNKDEVELGFSAFKWKMSSEDKNLDCIKNQDYETKVRLDSYFESAINLGLIELKFIE